MWPAIRHHQHVSHNNHARKKQKPTGIQPQSPRSIRNTKKWEWTWEGAERGHGGVRENGYLGPGAPHYGLTLLNCRDWWRGGGRTHFGFFFDQWSPNRWFHCLSLLASFSPAFSLILLLFFALTLSLSSSHSATDDELYNTIRNIWQKNSLFVF